MTEVALDRQPWEAGGRGQLLHLVGLQRPANRQRAVVMQDGMERLGDEPGSRSTARRDRTRSLTTMPRVASQSNALSGADNLRVGQVVEEERTGDVVERVGRGMAAARRWHRPGAAVRRPARCDERSRVRSAGCRVAVTRRSNPRARPRNQRLRDVRGAAGEVQHLDALARASFPMTRRYEVDSWDQDWQQVEGAENDQPVGNLAQSQ